MIEIYACTAILVGASLLAGAAILRLCGATRPLWLAGAVGFAALVTAAPFLIRLPGRGTTAAIVIGLGLAGCAALLWRGRRPAAREGEPSAPVGAAAALLAVGLASLPFFFQDHVGVLGEGIYINDHAAQLYWADWLQHGFGPEPSAVSFGYPIGPPALVATLATATGADLVSAFNGLLLAIPALTALTALAALRRLAPAPSVVTAALAAVCFLAVSFLAQSAFKETAMALFVLAFAIALQQRRPARGVIVSGLVLAAGSVFTYSLPGLVWFVAAVAFWLALEAIGGQSPIDYRAAARAIARHRLAVGLVTGAAVAVAVVAIGPAVNFVDKIGEVQDSLGRLGSPIFPGEVFGIWPQGDFRIVRGDVSGSLLAAALGFGAAGFGAWSLWRRRELALLAMLAAGAVVYVGARLVAQIHVEAKALGVVAPLVLLVGLRALLARRDEDEPARLATARWAAGALVAVAALGSSFVALRAAPVGFDERGEALERLAERIDGDPVVFLGVDRFAGYYLRGTLARAPAGYVPEEVEPREEKPWFQGYAVDFDNLDPAKLDQFDWAITTASAYNSLPPPSYERVAQDGEYVLWRRAGETPRSRIIAADRLPASDPLAPSAEANSPGAALSCSSELGRGLLERGGNAVIRPYPTTFEFAGWSGTPIEDPAGGQERGFVAGDPITLDLGAGLGDAAFELSLQYHSQVPLTVLYGGEEVGTLPPSLEGMYFNGAGRGAFWTVGEVQGGSPGDATVELVSEEPGGLRGALGAEGRIWPGNLVATPLASSAEQSIADSCRRYVDHFTLNRGGGG